MKKKILSVLLSAAMITALLAGCGAKSDSKTAENSSDATAKGTEITFMIPDWGAPSEELLKEFTDESGISVVVNEVSWDDIRDKIAIAASGGAAAADVVEVDWSWVGEFNSADWLEPIDVSDEDVADIPTLESFTVNDNVLAVPYANDFRIAYYNVEHFKAAGITEPPKTWDEVEDALIKIKEAGIVDYPYTMPLNADESATTSMIWMTLARNGVVFNDDDTLNKDAVTDALTFTNQLVNVDKLVDPAAKTVSGMDAYRKLLSGEASFMVGPTSFVGRSNDPEECQVVGQIMPILLPGKDSTSENTFALPEGIGVTKFSKNKAAAAEFVKWYTSADVQKKLFEENNSMPTRTSVLSKFIEDGTIVNAGAMLDESKLIMSPFPNGVPDYYSEMSNAIYNSVNKMALEEVSPEEAYSDMSKKVEELTK